MTADEGTARSTEVRMTPIGVVRNPVAGGKYDGWDEVVSELVLWPESREAMAGLDEFSHIEVIFWLKGARRPTEARIHPRDRADLPLVGYLATRTPNRPNPIGLSVVELLEVRENVLLVRGLDAFDGTPVLDVKPYLPRVELAQRAKVPAWVDVLRSGQG